MKFRNLAIAAAGVLLLAALSFAQITALEGDVIGVDGKPAVKVLVKITRTDIKGSFHVNTDKKGHYFYNGLPLGTYTITVEIDGKEMDTVNNVKSHLGDPTPVNFDLQKTGREAAAAQAKANAAGAAGAPLTKEQDRSMSKAEKEAYEKANKEREAAMKHNKELNDAFNAGMAAVQAKDYDAAVADFTKASEVDPKQPAVWAQLADAHSAAAKKKTGADFDAELAKAIDAYPKAIELNPTDAAIHNNYALALGQAKKYPEMQAELTKAAELEPAKAGQYYYNLGAMLVNAGQGEAACANFKKAIELDPNHADSYYQWGACLYAKATFSADGKVQPVPGTVDAYQKYLQLSPSGQFADTAKAMLESLDAKIDTTYKNPNAPAPKKKK
jgi:tetratricopeptide (TPR) repeat protein